MKLTSLLFTGRWVRKLLILQARHDTSSVIRHARAKMPIGVDYSRLLISQSSYLPSLFVYFSKPHDMVMTHRHAAHFVITHYFRELQAYKCRRCVGKIPPELCTLS